MLGLTFLALKKLHLHGFVLEGQEIVDFISRHKALQAMEIYRSRVSIGPPNEHDDYVPMPVEEHSEILGEVLFERCKGFDGIYVEDCTA